MRVFDKLKGRISYGDAIATISVLLTILSYFK